MKKREAVLYGIYMITFFIVYVCCLINEAVYHVCYWRCLEWTVSWEVLREVQIITVPLVAGLFLFSLCCKFCRIILIFHKK